jgi:hypothetical protein
MKLIVTQTDINQSTPAESCHCPIARALKKALDIPVDADEEDKEWVEVDGLTADVYARSENGEALLIRTYELPAKAEKFVDKVDSKGKKAVKPITLTLKRAK